LNSFLPAGRERQYNKLAIELTYDIRFKPRAIKDLADLKIQENLEEYEDLRCLREAKELEKDAPTIGLSEVKKKLRRRN